MLSHRISPGPFKNCNSFSKPVAACLLLIGALLFSWAANAQQPETTDETTQPRTVVADLDLDLTGSNFNYATYQSIQIGGGVEKPEDTDNVEAVDADLYGPDPA